MSKQELDLIIRILAAQAEESTQDAERMEKKGLPAEYDKGVKDGLTIAINALKRGYA